MIGSEERSGQLVAVEMEREAERERANKNYVGMKNGREESVRGTNVVPLRPRHFSPEPVGSGSAALPTAPEGHKPRAFMMQ